MQESTGQGISPIQAAPGEPSPESSSASSGPKVQIQKKYKRENEVVSAGAASSSVVPPIPLTPVTQRVPAVIEESSSNSDSEDSDATSTALDPQREFQRVAAQTVSAMGYDEVEEPPAGANEDGAAAEAMPPPGQPPPYRLGAVTNSAVDWTVLSDAEVAAEIQRVLAQNVSTMGYDDITEGTNEETEGVDVAEGAVGGGQASAPKPDANIIEATSREAERKAPSESEAGGGGQASAPAEDSRPRKSTRTIKPRSSTSGTIGDVRSSGSVVPRVPLPAPPFPVHLTAASSHGPGLVTVASQTVETAFDISAQANKVAELTVELRNARELQHAAENTLNEFREECQTSKYPHHGCAK